MGLVYRADEVRSSSKMHELFRLPVGAYILLTACNATVNALGTKVNPILACLLLESDPTVFAVVPVTGTVHSFDRVKNGPGRVNAERLVSKRIGRSRQKLRTICDGLIRTFKVSSSAIFGRCSWVTFAPDLSKRSSRSY